MMPRSLSFSLFAWMCALNVFCASATVAAQAKRSASTGTSSGPNASGSQSVAELLTGRPVERVTYDDVERVASALHDLESLPALANAVVAELDIARNALQRARALRPDPAQHAACERAKDISWAALAMASHRLAAADAKLQAQQAQRAAQVAAEQLSAMREAHAQATAALEAAKQAPPLVLSLPAAPPSEPSGASEAAP